MIEINVAAKPKPIVNAVALTVNGLYVLKNGMVIRALPISPTRVGGKVVYVPNGLAAEQNPLNVVEGNTNYLWSFLDGTFCTQEHNHNYPMHAHHECQQQWLDHLISLKPAAHAGLGIAHTNEPKEMLWAHWDGGGMLQWKAKSNNEWKPYYDHHNKNMDEWLKLTPESWAQHYAAYHIRRKP